jgi:alpha-ketoglutarate-dependent taurine dioxygenase
MRAELIVDLRSITAPDTAADRILDACHLARIVHVHAHPILGLEREFWEGVVSHHGAQVSVDEDALTGQPTGALWSDVEFDPAKPGVFRHSSSAQPLHTDGSYIGHPPEFVFLICNRPAARGGATMFVDGIDLFDILSAEHPKLLRELIRTPLKFAKGGSVVETPFLERLPGEVRLRWNYYALDRHLPEELRHLAEDLQSVLLRLAVRRRTRKILLRAGDAVFFSDARVLHGRDAFHAKQRGDRCLWKGGLDPRSAPATSLPQ